MKTKHNIFLLQHGRMILYIANTLIAIVCAVLFYALYPYSYAFDVEMAITLLYIVLLVWLIGTTCSLVFSKKPFPHINENQNNISLLIMSTLCILGGIAMCVFASLAAAMILTTSKHGNRITATTCMITGIATLVLQMLVITLTCMKIRKQKKNGKVSFDYSVSTAFSAALSTVGKKFFVKYYEKLRDWDYADLMDGFDENYSEENKRTRIQAAKAIFGHKSEMNALLAIAAPDSNIDNDTRLAARALLQLHFPQATLLPLAVEEMVTRAQSSVIPLYKPFADGTPTVNTYDIQNKVAPNYVCDIDKRSTTDTVRIYMTHAAEHKKDGAPKSTPNNDEDK